MEWEYFIGAEQSTSRPRGNSYGTTRTAHGVRRSIGDRQMSYVSQVSITDQCKTEYCASEIALNIDLILERLFAFLDRPGLMTARLVNKLWQKLGAKELQRQRRPLTINLVFERYENPIKAPNKSLRSLCSVIKNTATESLFTSFAVETRDLSYRSVQIFFNAFGSQIKKLKLSLVYFNQTISFNESSLMRDLGNLLFRQAPNLEFIQIEFYMPLRWISGLSEWDADDTHTKHWHSHRLLCRDSASGQVRQSNLLPKLKVLNIKGSLISMKFLQDMLDASVNLHSFGGSILSDSFLLVEYFMGGRSSGGKSNKIHLLKHLTLDLSFGFGFDGEAQIKLMEQFLVEFKDDLKLESVKSSFYYDGHFDSQRMRREEGEAANRKSRVAHIVNQIFEGSSSTLKKLSLRPMRCFYSVIFPRLWKLEELRLECNFKYDYLHPTNYYFFPREFNMVKCFPNVSRIVLSDDLIDMYIRRMDIVEPVPSVRYIYVKNKSNDTPVILPPASDFLHKFPNLVSISYTP